MDRRLYRDTFSKLHASQDRIQEVLSMTQEMNTTQRRSRRVRRSVLLAAAIMASLCVCAGAANAATGGALAERITYCIGDMLQINDYKMVAQTNEGGQVIVYSTPVDVPKEDGRVLLHLGEETIDITQELKENNAYTYEHTDGDTTIRVEVTPDPAHSGHWRYGVSFSDTSLTDEGEMSATSYGSTAPEAITDGAAAESETRD